MRPRPFRWNCGGIKRDKSAKQEFIRSRRRFSIIRCDNGSCCKRNANMSQNANERSIRVRGQWRRSWAGFLNSIYSILTRDGLFRLPGAKSASSSLKLALFVEKFKPLSPQYANPGSAASLKLTNPKIKQLLTLSRLAGNNMIIYFDWFFFLLRLLLHWATLDYRTPAKNW